MRSILPALVLLACASVGGAQPVTDGAAAALDGKLYKSIFRDGAGALRPADLPGISEPLRSRLTRYLARRGEFKSRYTSRSDTLEEMRADAKKRSIERAIVALVEAPGIEETAAAFVSGAPIAGEWNGLHDGPLAEAAFAEDVLKKDPASALAPWLYVFIAERQRVAFETYENEKDEAGMKTSARKYRTFLERARAVEDPIYPALVNDLDRQPYLYLRSSSHPRDYDPDT